MVPKLNCLIDRAWQLEPCMTLYQGIGIIRKSYIRALLVIPGYRQRSSRVTLHSTSYPKPRAGSYRVECIPFTKVRCGTQQEPHGGRIKNHCVSCQLKEKLLSVQCNRDKPSAVVGRNLT